MEKFSTIELRVEEKTLAQAAEILSRTGMTVEIAVSLLLKRIVEEKNLPPGIKVPNAVTRAALEDAQEMINEHKNRQLGN